MAETLTIPGRFNGPPESANGGYFAGRAAELLNAEPTTVTLRLPPPLATALDVVRDHAGVRISAGDALVAEAGPGTITSEPVLAIPYDEAVAAAARYGGLVQHPFPTCFSCGIARSDGLGLRPGLMADAMTAASWTPDESLRIGGEIPAAIVWAALDCPGGWTVDLVGRPMVLGRMTAVVDTIPTPGERCVVMGRLDGRDGRKAYTTTTAYGGDGSMVGRAQATWIEVRPSV